ncbi:unnamed protein product [Heligmosomoides polygyrus]|uniref:Peptidase A2 domain-containing protein n=1 Tax=Heligmosomoides polygyrus TaxID=6339 RepID=A0A183G6V0_HELPZ|nr:unnamed protein product [Heligmosomoides polygyrus]
MEREIDRIIEEDEQEQSRMAKLQQELAQLRQQVQAMAQQNTLQVKLATTAITAHVSKLTQLPEQVADALWESETSTPEEAIQKWHKLLEPGCEAILSVLPLLSEAALMVERTVADANKKHHEELSAVFDQAIHDDMSMRALSKLLDVESTRVVDTVKSLIEERQKGDSSQMSTIGKGVLPRRKPLVLNNSTLVNITELQAQSTTEPQPMGSTTHMEANAQEEQFRSAFRLLNTGDLDMEAPLPPVTFDAVRAANGARQQGNEIFGPKTTCEVQLLGRSYRALVDTGSQVRILPLNTLTTASKSGFDLDADVEEVELDSRTHIYDASGHRMSFKGAVRLTLTQKDGPEERVVFLVKKGADDTIVLGTNILDKIGVQASPTAQQRPKSRTIGTQTGERDKEYEDKELAHPDLFPTSPGYDIELYYRMAMARRTQITSQSPDDMPGNPILVAVPKHFGRVLTDVIEPTTVKFLVYSHFGDLADQLQKQCISSAFVWVWPNVMQSTQHMLLVQQAVERHLQCGGTMELFPPPFELSGKRNGDTSGSTIGDDVPIKHPAISLGVCPRKGEDRLMAWQCQIFLNQLAHTASSILMLPTFELAQRKPVKQPQSDRPSTTANVPAAEKQKTKRRGFDAFYVKDAKKKRLEQAHLMKQTGRPRGKH